ncbi:nuclear transport factor 2 family protein [Leptolyngbya sp. FACHB-261]|uniref:nuclear transport factor 2 family protein n=1 Tax=Leptolyngbya sp. FACHB-261 TaxID=2692806 RepID=UPI0016896644|nr:nuclear transport factor 2 family protein [Leptolyngbya sp. FACHB-261]MBD2100591.1 nuclear transport factor 2 family protein [Leptolyngbya sp. FACHB-261]
MDLSTEAAVLQANQSFYRAFAEKDIEAMTEIWSKGSSVRCIHPGRTSTLRGWPAVRQSWEQIFRNTDDIKIDLEDVMLEVYENIALVTLVENIQQSVEGRSGRFRTSATNIFEQLAGRWYLIHHHGG